MRSRHPSDSTARRYAHGALPAVRPVREGGDDKEHSGRLLLRMPRTLHAELARLAEQRGVSLNQLIVGLLSHSLANGASSSAPSDAGQTAKSEDAAQVQRRLGVVLTVNLVVLLLAGGIAIALLIVALSGGF